MADRLDALRDYLSEENQRITLGCFEGRWWARIKTTGGDVIVDHQGSATLTDAIDSALTDAGAA